MKESAVLEDIAKRLNQLIDERGWSVYKLSRASGVSKKSINNARYAASGIEVLTLARLCEALNVTFGEFFKERIHKGKHLTDEEDELVAVFRGMDDSERKQLKAYADGIVAAKKRK